MHEQAISAGFAWLVVLGFLAADLNVARQRRHVPWEVALGLGVGALLVALAGAVTATNAISGALLPHEWVWFVVVARAVASAILLAVLMRLTARPRWLIRWVERL